MVTNGVALKRPDKTGHFPTFAQQMQNAEFRMQKGGDGAGGQTRVGNHWPIYIGPLASEGTEQGRYSLVKESAGPQRQVGEDEKTHALYI